MPDFRIGNLSVRVEDQALPNGVIQGLGGFAGDRALASAADSGCGCTCSCTCTCTSTSGGSLTDITEVELAVLRESLRSALNNLEGIEKQRKAEH